MSRSTTPSRLTHRCAPVPERGEPASSRLAKGRKPAKAMADTTRNTTHSPVTASPRKAAMAAATAPRAKGARKNEPATPISPSVAATATANQIHRHVSGELIDIYLRVTVPVPPCSACAGLLPESPHHV